MGNALFYDPPEVVEEGKKTKVKTYCKHEPKYGPNGCFTLLSEAVGPIRELGKRAIKLRQIAGVDKGQAIKDWALYLDDSKFVLQDCNGIQDMGPGVVYLKELDMSKNKIKVNSHPSPPTP